MDLYIKQAIIHQFTPDDTELRLSEQPLQLTPRLDEYLRKKIERVYTEEAKTGIFEPENAFFGYMKDDLPEVSVRIAKLWQEEFSISEQQKTNDLVFIAFDKEGQEHFAFLRLALREQLVHSGLDDTAPIQISQNNLPSSGAAPDEALIVNKVTRKYHLIEKRIKYNGSFLNYFSDNLLQVEPVVSAKKSIQTVEKTAQKIAETFHQDDFQFQSKLKKALYDTLQEEQGLSPERLADQLFEENLTARLSFVDQVKEQLPSPIVFEEIDTSRQMKKLENQKLSLSNGIELLVPTTVYEDAEAVEFIQNPNGTYSILIKNIEDIRNV